MEFLISDISNEVKGILFVSGINYVTTYCLSLKLGDEGFTMEELTAMEEKRIEIFHQ